MVSMPFRVGIIGFGEVGSTFAAAMRACGAEVAACDLLPERIASAGVAFFPLPELASRSEYLLSTVTTMAARNVAVSCLPYLTENHVYVDLNSTSPSVKIELDRLVRETGARFVEGAILGAVGVTGAGTRILAGGPAAQAASETLRRLGLRVSFYSEQIGRASTFKMLRSIFSKGLEALLLELLIAGRRAGICEDLWADIAEFMATNPFEGIAENWLQTHPLAYERRYHEVLQAAETMREIGLEPLMTAATGRLFERSSSMGLNAAFPSRPASMHDVVAFMESRMRRGENTSL
jgi:3-hydroxyisobutyrate dehydrogenase-like beta-hydroxyacid dehydrogenase